MCPAVPYNILTSNCTRGRCPTTTDDTKVTWQCTFPWLIPSLKLWGARFRLSNQFYPAICVRLSLPFFKKLNPRNPKEFWRAVKILNKKQCSIPTLSSDSCKANTGPEKANLLNIFFSKCFNQSVPPLSKGDNDALPQMLNPNDFPPEEFLHECWSTQQHPLLPLLHVCSINHS